LWQAGGGPSNPQANWSGIRTSHWTCAADQSTRKVVAAMTREPKISVTAAPGRRPPSNGPNPRAPRRTWLSVAAAAGAMAAVGSSFAVLDTLRDYPASGGQAARYAVGAALLFLLAGRRLPRPTARQLVQLALLAATGLAAFNLLVMAAEASMDPGSVGVIVASVPVLLALAGPLQDGRRVEPRVVGAAVLVAAGAAAVQGLGGELTAEGLAAALGALACEAAFSLLAAPLLAPLGPVAVSAWAAILAVPMLLATGLAIDGPGGLLRTPTVDEVLALGWLAVIVTAVAFTLWYSAVQALGVERAGLLSGVLPVSALLVAALLGRSELTAGRLAGAMLVGAGIAAGLASASRTRGAKPATDPALTPATDPARMPAAIPEPGHTR
jgi:drug/metabolite transporter (DMT)-like permease